MLNCNRLPSGFQIALQKTPRPYIFTEERGFSYFSPVADRVSLHSGSFCSGWVSPVPGCVPPMFALLFLRGRVARFVTRRVQNGRIKTKPQFSPPTQEVSRYQQRDGVIARTTTPSRDPAPVGVAKKKKNVHSGPPPSLQHPASSRERRVLRALEARAEAERRRVSLVGRRSPC